MARGKATSDEVRAQVMAALLAGQGVTEIAEERSLPHQTVSDLKRALEREFGELRPEKKDEIGELLTGYVRANLNALRVQTEHAADTTWLKKQSASEVAVLHGVLADKLVRILEAAEAGREYAEQRGGVSANGNGSHLAPVA
jgi:hypothetical protein